MSKKEPIPVMPLPDVDVNSPDWATTGEAAGEIRYCERVVRQLVADYIISRKVRGRRWIYLPALRACMEMQTRA